MCQYMAGPVCCAAPHRRELEIPAQSGLQAGHHPCVHVSNNGDMIKIGDSILWQYNDKMV